MKKVPYLYSMVSEKIEELMRKSPRMELDTETLKRDLPGKMKLTRGDVLHVIKEMEKGGMLFIKDGKVKRKHE